MSTLIKLGDSTYSTPAKPATSTPVTPASQTAASPSSETPGTWRHPRLDEITRRQRANTFTDRNARTVVWNLVWLMLSFVVVAVSRTIFNPNMISFIASAVVYPTVVRWAIRATFMFNIALACWPLVRPKDDLSDIPLTPSQRKLLGLEPADTPATPESGYHTPPRYSRSATPRSAGGSPVGSRRASPFSGRERGSPLGLSGSPAASPLFQKAIGSGVSRRHSYGSGSPLGGSIFGPDSSGSNTPATPTPVNKNTGVALNSKWLYERGRNSPNSRGIYS